ncbi:MAG TPA: hypothetical protein PLU30_08385 [Verrucomicrobiae bacterium]|nr:hypothetical protein [Verrucomicrobiae bacterium]
MRKGALVAYILIGLFGGALGQGDNEQETRRVAYAAKVAEMIHIYDGQLFGKWICLGSPERFRTALMRPDLRIVVTGSGSDAQYIPNSRVLEIPAEPATYLRSISSSHPNSGLLWHETIHVMSHDHQTGRATPPAPFRSFPPTIADPKEGIDAARDHYYIEWAENAMEGLIWLVRLENKLRAGGTAVPPPDAANETRGCWQNFLKSYNSSKSHAVPNDKERKELEVMTGFHVDANEILSGYLALGYPLEYFGDYATDPEIWALFPGADELVAQGLKTSQARNPMEKLSVTFIRSWVDGPPGRNCTVQLTVFGSIEVSRAFWNAAVRSPLATPVPDIGEEALLFKDNGQPHYVVARFWNCHLLHADEMIQSGAPGVPPTIVRSMPSAGVMRRMLHRIEKRGSPPFVPGLLTAVPAPTAP